jgi:hypothetical protein
MSLEEMIRRQAPFHALPLWRRIVIVCCLGLAIFVGVMTFGREMDIYGSAPDHPVVATGQTYQVHVNHGFVRYVTLLERDKLIFWESNIGNLAGAPVLAAFLLWIFYKDPVVERQPGPRVNTLTDSHRN